MGMERGGKLAKQRVYSFGEPGHLGGAGTKFAHTVSLLAQDYEICLVTPSDWVPKSGAWLEWCHQRSLSVRTYDELPQDMRGSWGLSMCNEPVIRMPFLAELRKRGMRFAWSNEMMWALPGELGAIGLGRVDKILYVSKAQRQALGHFYHTAWTGRADPSSEIITDPEAMEGEILGPLGKSLPWVVTGNYINPAEFPFRERSLDSERPLVLGRLSRDDAAKFPKNFPESYENLGLRNPRFRVMGWGEKLAAQFPGHSFDQRWELIPECGEPTVEFLHSLDLFVYQIGSNCRESWGRAVVEAALCGAVPLVPKGDRHHLENLIVHGKTGFACEDDGQYSYYARLLEDNPELRRKMAREGREWTEKTLCNAEEHRALWAKVFT